MQNHWGAPEDFDMEPNPRAEDRKGVLSARRIRKITQNNKNVFA